MNIMREQIGNFNWETPAIKKNRVDSLVLKNIITKIKNSLDGLTDHPRYYRRKVFKQNKNRTIDTAQTQDAMQAGEEAYKIYYKEVSL